MSSFLISALILTLVVIIYAASQFIPGLNPAKIGPFDWTNYAHLLCFYILPNLLVYGLLVFSVILRTRNIYSGFGVVISLFFLQSIIVNIAGDNLEMIALLDPLAENSFLYETMHWDGIQRNESQLPWGGTILYNRLIWTCFALLAFFFAYRKFDLHQNVEPIFNWKKSGQRVTKRNFSNLHRVVLPKVNLKFNLHYQWTAFLQLIRLHLRYIFRSPLFLSLTALAIITIIFTITKLTSFDAMALLPETRVIIYFPAVLFKIIIMLLVFLYSGMLIHREQKNGVNELADVVAVPTSILMLSKFCSIIIMQAALLLSIMLTGIGMQIFNDYYNFEIDLYLRQLLGIDLINMMVWTMVAFLTHSFIKNSFVGSFLLLGFWVLTANLDQLKVETILFSYNKVPILQYSNINGYGHGLERFFTVQLYWLGFGVLFLVFSYLFYNRGLISRFKDRWHNLVLRFNAKVIGLMLSAILLATFYGFSIYEAEQEEAYLSRNSMKVALADYKEKFSHYTGFPQPKIMAANFEMDLYPEVAAFDCKGFYWIKNDRDKAIDTLLVRCGFDERTDLIDRGDFTIIEQDDYFQFYVLQLNSSLKPGDSMQLYFDIKNKENTVLTRFSGVIENGTFLKADLFPRLGYKDDRKAKTPFDPEVTQYHAYATDSDVLHFEAKISTDASQMVIAPGRLLESKTEGKRAYFHYKTDSPINFTYGIHSGMFDHYEEDYNGVNIEVWHHPGHNARQESMVKGIKAALDYNIQNFGPYQHKDARVIEFPSSEGTYATAFGNNIPISEMRFSMVKGSGEDAVDLPFYIPAHEMTHQWWGNQLMPAAAAGSRMLTESITEYLTLNIYRETISEEEANNFLKLQRKRYLRRYRWVKGVESPLVLVQPNQQYLFYGKGSMAFHAIGHKIGEQHLNRILKEYLDCYPMPKAPYPTSIDFVQYLKEETLDTINSMISDWFEHEVIYELSIDSASVRQNGNSFLTELNVSHLKMWNKDTVALDEKLELEILFEDGSKTLSTIHCQKQNGIYQIESRKPPKQIYIDPHFLTIEKDIEDNLWENDR